MKVWLVYMWDENMASEQEKRLIAVCDSEEKAKKHVNMEEIEEWEVE